MVKHESTRPQTHGALDKQSVELFRAPVTLLHQMQEEAPWRLCPMTHFPSDKNVFWLVGWRASRAGRNSPSWGYTRLLGDTPWHGQASPCCGIQPHLSQATGPLSSALMGRVLLEGHSLLTQEAPSWPCIWGASGFEDDALRSYSIYLAGQRVPGI